LYKILVLFFFTLTYSFSALIGSNFNKLDIQILDELDIEPSFITDYELQKTYTGYITRNTQYYKDKFNDAIYFIPIIKDILRSEGIPSSFVYLPQVYGNLCLKQEDNMA
jgi:membrane-bound lytic murein transglycosylase D